jgi:hypothetical protein
MSDQAWGITFRASGIGALGLRPAGRTIVYARASNCQKVFLLTGVP